MSSYHPLGQTPEYSPIQRPITLKLHLIGDPTNESDDPDPTPKPDPPLDQTFQLDVSELGSDKLLKN